MSHVTYHVSHVTCKLNFVFFNFFGPSGEASCLRVFYQQDLPRFRFFENSASNCQKIALSKKSLLKKSNLTTNLILPVNQETILGFVLEFKIIPIYLHVF